MAKFDIELVSIRRALKNRISTVNRGIRAGGPAITKAQRAIKAATTPQAKKRAQLALDKNRKSLAAARESLRCLKAALKLAENCCCDARENCNVIYQ